MWPGKHKFPRCAKDAYATLEFRAIVLKQINFQVSYYVKIIVDICQSCYLVIFDVYNESQHLTNMMISRTMSISYGKLCYGISVSYGKLCCVVVSVTYGKLWVCYANS